LNRHTKELAKYQKCLTGTELSKSTKEIYLRQAKVFLDFIGNKPICKKEMIAYKSYLMEQRYKSTTINLYIVAVNHFVRSMGYKNVSIRTERLQKRGCPDNVLNKEEYMQMLNYAKESGKIKYYYLMRTLALTGIRISELSDCTVEALARGRFLTRNKGKTREIYLPDKLVAELTQYCNTSGIKSGVIFRGNKGTAISRISIYKMLRHLADMTDIPKEKAHPHSFRHLFAITYMEQYSNLFELADILGHASLETTRVYTATTGETKRRKIEMLNL
jgi:integrase